MTKKQKETMNFINANDVRVNKDQIKLDRVYTLINTFNNKISSGACSEDTVFYLNQFLDRLPILTEKEFEYAVSMALKQGWVLTKTSDQLFYFVTYKLTKYVAG